MFRSVYNRGFQITFENGLTISVQFGEVNYCERRTMTTDINADLKHPLTESNTAEVAIWDEKESMVTMEAFNDVFDEQIDDGVAGWISADKVAQLIEWCAKR